jgi:hypothetical protein
MHAGFKVDRQGGRMDRHEGRVNAHRALLVCALALATGCSAKTQSLSVDTVPGGAEVFLQRRGYTEVEAAVVGVVGVVDGGDFEEEWITLGNAPVEYEFELTESKGAFYWGGSGGNVRQHYREGTIRVELRGHRSISRLLSFSGDRIRLTLELPPEEP